MAELWLFEDNIAEIAARLDLREPNREAIETLAASVSQYYDVDEAKPPFEAVIASATGVGKTYILVGALEFFAAAYGVRDFVIVTPGRTILEKTKDNFTPGHPKSLLGPINFRPVVITAENFATPAMKSAMDDDSQIKVYLFTVQSLIRPESKTGRKTHKFQEGLGTEFYAHLQSINQLVVFADEHHCYYGPAFSNAVRNLTPWVLVGLTATPDKKTPEEQIIFRYPLVGAIADKLVKTPVIVGRRDDRADPHTKLTDGITLLNAKADSLDAYTQARGLERVNPVMLVVAKSIDDANEYGAVLRSGEFFNGAYANAVLVVHSNAPDEALEELAKVEDPNSPVRIIISVGMLKEGWDVRNVYVIASMRSSVSEILTEQTLGRGMRLPFGGYTGIEILDTLEVVAHERYEDLLKKAGVLNETFMDFRTRMALRVNAKGQTVAVSETVETKTTPVVSDEGDGGSKILPESLGAHARPVVTSILERTKQVGDEVLRLKQEIGRRPDAPRIFIPILSMTTVKNDFSLADITEMDKFRKLGMALATDPDGELNRTLVSAELEVGSDGIKHTRLIRSKAADSIRSAPSLFPLDELQTRLADMVLASPAIPARKEQRRALHPIIEAFFEGLGSKAEEILSANINRAGARLIGLIAEEQRRFMKKPSYGEVVEVKEFNPIRTNDREVSEDLYGPFDKAKAYTGWVRALFAVNWFDSEPERTTANIVDKDDNVKVWVRLYRNDLPILWSSAGNWYNPDFLVIETNGTHWVVEDKMDKEMTSEVVQAKREAAQRWANRVSAELGTPWRYLLVSQTDVDTVRESWEALKRLGA